MCMFLWVLTVELHSNRSVIGKATASYLCHRLPAYQHLWPQIGNESGTSQFLFFPDAVWEDSGCVIQTNDKLVKKLLLLGLCALMRQDTCHFLTILLIRDKGRGIASSNRISLHIYSVRS